MEDRWNQLQSRRLKAVFDRETGYLLSISERDQARPDQAWPDLIQACYCHVRRNDWSTAMPETRVNQFEVSEDNFHIAWNCSVNHHGLGFSWNGHAQSLPSGGIEYGVEGQAAGSFESNRIGLCTLIPQEWEGWLVQSDSPETPQSELPAIVRHIHPITHFQKLAWNGWQVHLDGDLYGMEDQRNWGDASYKIFPIGSQPGTWSITPEFTMNQTVKIEPANGNALCPIRSFPQIEPTDRARITFPIPSYDSQFAPAGIPLIQDITMHPPEAPRSVLRFRVHPQVHVFDPWLTMRNAAAIGPISRSLRACCKVADFELFIKSPTFERFEPSREQSEDPTFVWAACLLLAAGSAGIGRQSQVSVHFEGISPTLLQRLQAIFLPGAVISDYPIGEWGDQVRLSVNGKTTVLNLTPFIAKIGNNSIPPWGCR